MSISAESEIKLTCVVFSPKTCVPAAAILLIHYCPWGGVWS